MINGQCPERPATRGLLMSITVGTAATVTIQVLIPHDLEAANADDHGIQFTASHSATVVLGDQDAS